jgi:predicted lipid-binding transport protein (Tim44 family)
MKNWLIGALVIALAGTALPEAAEAKRLGGGKSSGLQRDMPARTSPDATPAKPAAPQQAAPTQAATPGAAAAPAAAPKRSWMGPIAGLAAGLGLAALMSHLGFGEEFANFLMMALLAVAAIALVMFLLRRFGPARGAATPALAGAGAGMGSGAAPGWQQPVPMQRQSSTPSATSLPDAAPAAAATTPAITRAFVPAAFDSEGFARTAKMIFIRLQAANDSADLDDLRKFTTPELFASLRLDLQERGPSPQATDVVAIEAEVLDVANEAERQVVSVRFHGQVVEEAGAPPVAVDEVWHLVKPHDDSRSWAIAGIEQVS